MIRWIIRYGLIVLVSVALAGCDLVGGNPPPPAARSAIQSFPTVTPVVLADGADLRYVCANGGMYSQRGPNLLEVTCSAPPTPSETASATQTPTPSDTPSPSPSTTPSETPTPTDTPTATATDTATSTDTPVPTSTPTFTDTPTSTPTATPSGWAGPLSWGPSNTQIGTVTGIALWNALMRPSDVPNLAVTQVTTLEPQIMASQPRAGLQLSGTFLTPTTQVTTQNLALIDTSYQKAHGPVVEWVNFSDDDANGYTVAQKVAAMHANLDAIRHYARANGAPPFKVAYVPGGAFLQANLAANPILATYPDAVVFQTQSFEDQATGADPIYLATVIPVIQQLRSDAPSHPIEVQFQTYSKSNNAVVWTDQKVEADIDAVTSTVAVDDVNIWFADASATAASNTVFLAVLAHYRP